MMTKTTFKQFKFHCLTLDELVPEDHLVRKLQTALNWSFIYDLVQDKYSALGRPSIDPVQLFKIVLLNIICGNNSIRKTCRQIETDFSLRWFLGIDLDEPVPNYSDWSQNYIRRYSGTDVCGQIFEYILDRMVEKGLVDSTVIYGDSTHQKANANKNKSTKVAVKIEERFFEQDLKEAINASRKEHGKKPLEETFTTILEFDEKTGEEKETIIKAGKTKTLTKSTTDPEAGRFHKGEKERCYAYSQHVFCDKNGVVLGVSTHPGNEHDSITFFEAYDSLPDSILKNTRAVVLDAGYKTPAIAKFLLDSQIIPFLPYKRPMTKDGFFKKYEYVYDPEKDIYTCPNGQELTYRTTNRVGYKEYKSNPDKCKDCPFRDKCTKSKNKVKVITRHVWQENLDAAENIRHTPDFKKYYPKRKETIERVFAENKEHHNLRWTRLRGLQKNRDQAKLVFACHNLLKLAIWT